MDEQKYQIKSCRKSMDMLLSCDFSVSVQLKRKTFEMSHKLYNLIPFKKYFKPFFKCLDRYV